MKDVKEFLEKNGLHFNSEKERYENTKCTVFIDKIYECYEVKFDMEDKNYTIYSQSLNIYWLIGLLTYENLIDRNYIS